MRAAVFAPAHNKVGRKDATGAFHPEATAFCRMHRIIDKVHLIDNHGDPYEMREAVYKVIDDMPRHGMEAIAFFCHGWRSGIQFGIGIEHLQALAIRIKIASGVENLPVMLYACDAGRDRDDDEEDDRSDFLGGDGGFADRLRDTLNNIGCKATVYAHSTEGHTTRNPFLRIFLPGERMGGRFIVDRQGPLWQKWVRALRTTELRFELPWMTPDEIKSVLEQS